MGDGRRAELTGVQGGTGPGRWGQQQLTLIGCLPCARHGAESTTHMQLRHPHGSLGGGRYSYLYSPGGDAPAERERKELTALGLGVRSRLAPSQGVTESGL